MERYITDEHTGLKYELIGDYYLIAGDDEPAELPIGIWGQRHLWYLKQHKNGVYTGMLLTGKLDSYLREIDLQAEDMFSRLVNEIVQKKGITETLKASDQMEWVQRMNTVRETAKEIVNNNLIYA